LNKVSKSTQKEYYVKPPPTWMNDELQKNIRFNLLKIACDHQPETYEEQLMRELNINP
jgi:hypothetical protein